MITFPPVPFTPVNLSQTELVRHIEHHYPNLDGPLLVLLRKNAGGGFYREDNWKPLMPADPCKCPHCGTKFTVSET